MGIVRDRSYHGNADRVDAGTAGKKVAKGRGNPEALKCKICGSIPTQFDCVDGHIVHCSWVDCPQYRNTKTIVGWFLDGWNKRNETT